MARVLMVAFVALIAMSLCSAAYAQAGSWQFIPTQIPTRLNVPIGLPSDPVPQSFDSARGNVVIFDPQASIRSRIPFNSVSPTAEIDPRSFIFSDTPYLDSARGNLDLGVPAHAQNLAVGVPYGYFNPLPQYLNSARGNVAIFDPQTSIRSRIPFNSARDNAELVPYEEGVAGLFAGGSTRPVPFP